MEKEERARWLRDMLCGALIGAGAILPGVSGGVLAVIFDVYRPLMETLTHPKRGFLQYWHIFCHWESAGQRAFWDWRGASRRPTSFLPRLRCGCSSA